MTQKLMTPKEALKEISNTTISSRIGDWGMESRHVSDLSSTKEPLQIISQALNELEELKRDVKRFMELEEQDTFNSQEEHDEFGVLYDKLLKVGVK